MLCASSPPQLYDSRKKFRRERITKYRSEEKCVVYVRGTKTRSVPAGSVLVRCQGLKVKVPASAVHVGNTARPAIPSGNTELVASTASRRALCLSRPLPLPQPRLPLAAPAPAPAPASVPGPSQGRRPARPVPVPAPAGAGGWLSRSICICKDSQCPPSISCPMFMFRTRKKNSLCKRLWNARVLRDYEARRENEEDVGEEVGQGQGQHQQLRTSLLKRLAEHQLETLVQAVESHGSSPSACVLLPPGTSPEPQVLFCQIWRWPGVQQGSELRRLPTVCPSAGDPNNVCCNPYHWSRLIKPESPPPPYCRPVEERLKVEDRAPSEADRGRGRWYGSYTTNGEGTGDTGGWCQLAYWELAERVGHLFSVHPLAINVSTTAEPAIQEGLDLDTLAQKAPGQTSDAVKRTRAQIGLGVTLSNEEDGVWAYNRSQKPIFVNSPTLDDPESRTHMVFKVPPGHCLNIFRADMTSTHWERWRMRNRESRSGPVDSHAVRISFAKGWGPKYTRQEVTACPCWLEVLLQRPCPCPCPRPCR